MFQNSKTFYYFFLFLLTNKLTSSKIPTLLFHCFATFFIQSKSMTTKEILCFSVGSIFFKMLMGDRIKLDARGNNLSKLKDGNLFK